MSVSFSALGCGPYTRGDFERIEEYLRSLPSKHPGSSFVVHLGDHFQHKSGDRNLDVPRDRERNELTGQTAIERAFEHAAATFRIIPGETLGFVAVPGDNDWFAFPSRQHDLAKALWRRYFLEELPRSFHVMDRAAQLDGPPENVALFEDGVCFIAIHRIGIRAVLDLFRFNEDEWRRRLNDDLRWIRRCIEHAGGCRALVVLSHAAPESRPHGAFNTFFPYLRREFRENYLLPLRALIRRSELPTLFVHADSHAPVIEELPKYGRAWRLGVGRVGRRRGSRFLAPLQVQVLRRRHPFRVRLPGGPVELVPDLAHINDLDAFLAGSSSGSGVGE